MKMISPLHLAAYKKLLDVQILVRIGGTKNVEKLLKLLNNNFPMLKKGKDKIYILN